MDISVFKIPVITRGMAIASFQGVLFRMKNGDKNNKRSLARDPGTKGKIGAGLKN